jgi:glutaminyl-tRNA synthetase
MSATEKSLNFIEHIVEEDLKSGLRREELKFRFPPEPNGYLHIGHTKAIGISFGLGEKYDAPVNLRFDDTNPAKEEQEYVDAIKKDISWLGYQWAEECYSSDYFQQLYDWAERFIVDGLAYVDSQSSEAIAEQKGTPVKPGTNSPFRNRSVEENLELFRKMKAGEFKEGAHVLRAKIDMTHDNMLMRDPIMYRILHASHHRTGKEWYIYPMYDWTHGESDYIEQISHSLCSLEFKPHRPLYNWFRDHVHNYSRDTLPLPPKQREFARLNLSYTIMSKRKLLRLVQEGIVNGWDDPRMPTISGLRRRGYTPNSIRNFIEKVGVAKRENVIDVALLEFCAREDLNKTTQRVMAVLNPLKIVITNYPEGKVEWVETENNPEDPNSGTRKIPFSREIYIEKEDFREQANRKYFRLKLGGEVRLKSAYIIRADKVIKNDMGEVIEVQCTYTTDKDKKVKGTLHWVSAGHAIKAEVREYDRLFMNEAPDEDKDQDFMQHLNPNSLKTKTGYLEPGLEQARPGDHYQFQRLGYFNVDDDSKPEALVFNKTVGLRDGWTGQKKNLHQPQKKSTQPDQPGKSAVKLLQQFGKKYPNLPEEKQEKMRDELVSLAPKISYEELEELFGTAVKKVGTRVATMIVLKQQLKNGLVRNEAINSFIEKAMNDKSPLLVKEAQSIE